jgi:hypothetical protein
MRVQDAALQTCLDVMRELLLDEGLRASEPASSVRCYERTDVGDN